MPGFSLEIAVTRLECYCFVERIKVALVLRDEGEKQLILGNSDRPRRSRLNESQETAENIRITQTFEQLRLSLFEPC